MFIKGQCNKYQILNESVQVLLGGAAVPDFKTAYPAAKKKQHKQVN